MPSRALREWRTTQRAELDRLEAAARSSQPALRQQLVDAYILWPAGGFQLYCRSLHDEAVDHAVGSVRPASAGVVMSQVLLRNRHLDRGNAHPAALADDFRWLAYDFWADLLQQDPRNERRRRLLDQLNVWRNAIAHQALPPSGGNATRTAGTTRTLHWALLWRANCSALAQQMDKFVRTSLTNQFGVKPW
jgi:hypothetical protein